MRIITNVVSKLASGLNHVSMIVTFCMMFFIAADVIMRFVFNSPILGGYEIVEQFMVVLVFAAFAHTQVRKGHIAVDIVTQAVPPKVKEVMNIICMLIATGMIGLSTYAQYLQIIALERSNATTTVLYISVVPFAIALFVAMALFTLTLFLDMIQSIIRLAKGETPAETEEEINLAW